MQVRNLKKKVFIHLIPNIESLRIWNIKISYKIKSALGFSVFQCILVITLYVFILRQGLSM